MHAENLWLNPQERGQEVNGERDTKHLGEQADKESSSKACALPFLRSVRPGQEEKEKEEDSSSHDNGWPISIPLLKTDSGWKAIEVEKKECKKQTDDKNDNSNPCSVFDF